jgi:type IV pilus assembly protein PilA
MRSAHTVDPRSTRGRDCAIVAVIVLVIAAIAIPNLIEARKQGAEASPIGALKTIGTSQTLFREGDKDGDGTLDYATLDELSNATLIDGLLGSGVKQGYRFTCFPSVESPELLWFATANPVEPGETGDRYFCTNHAGVIYYTGSLGGSISPLAGGPDCSIPANLLPVGK